MKRVAVRYDVAVIFSAPAKLSGSRAHIGRKKPLCEKRYGESFVDSAIGGVYEIPLTFGAVYMSQIGCCMNDRALERHRSLKEGTGSNLPLHYKECTREWILDGISILGRSLYKLAHELLKAISYCKER